RSNRRRSRGVALDRGSRSDRGNCWAGKKQLRALRCYFGIRLMNLRYRRGLRVQVKAWSVRLCDKQGAFIVTREPDSVARSRGVGLGKQANQAKGLARGILLQSVPELAAKRGRHQCQGFLQRGSETLDREPFWIDARA